MPQGHRTRNLARKRRVLLSHGRSLFPRKGPGGGGFSWLLVGWLFFFFSFSLSLSLFLDSLHCRTGPAGFASEIIRTNWHDTEKISMAPAPG